jgi:hypothetical protein
MRCVPFLESSRLVPPSHFCLPIGNIYYLTWPLFIITDYEVRFIVTDGSVGLHLFIP